MDSLAVGNPVDDLDALGRLAAATDRQILEGGVGGDDEVGHRVGEPLENHQRFIEKALVAVLDDEQLRR